MRPRVSRCHLRGQVGPVSTGWELSRDASKPLRLTLLARRSENAFKRIDGTLLLVPEPPAAGTSSTFEAGKFCYCPDEQPFASRDGCVADDPGYASSTYEGSTGVVCEPVGGWLEVKQNDLRCEHVSAILPATCSGDLDLTVTIPERPDRRLSATLRVVEHSEHEVVTCSMGPM